MRQLRHFKRAVDRKLKVGGNALAPYWLRVDKSQNSV